MARLEEGMWERTAVRRARYSVGEIGGAEGGGDRGFSGPGGWRRAAMEIWRRGIRGAVRKAWRSILREGMEARGKGLDRAGRRVDDDDYKLSRRLELLRSTVAAAQWSLPRQAERNSLFQGQGGEGEGNTE